MRVGAAASAAEALEKVSQDKSLTLANVVQGAQLRRAFGRASASELSMISTTDPNELRQLRQLYHSGKTDEAKKLAISMGIYGANAVHDEASADTALKANLSKQTNTILGFGVEDTQMIARIQAKHQRGEKLTDQEQTIWNRRTRQTLGKGVSGVATYGETDAGSVIGQRGVGGSGKASMNAEDASAAAAMGNAKVLEDGLRSLDKTIGGINNLGTQLTTLATKMNVKEYAEAVAKSAGELTMNTGQFDKAATKFDTAVDKFVAAISGNAAPTGSAKDAPTVTKGMKDWLLSNPGSNQPIK
jgi:hypothetical protein